MEIKRIESQPTASSSAKATAGQEGSAEWFTGSVRIQPLFEAPEPARARGASVTFEPGARTAWHTHPLGQTLIVTSGLGWAQREGGPIEEIRPGDVVWFAPNEKHWHGATPTKAMTHIAIQETLNGRSGRLDGARCRQTISLRKAGTQEIQRCRPLRNPIRLRSRTGSQFASLPNRPSSTARNRGCILGDMSGEIVRSDRHS